MLLFLKIRKSGDSKFSLNSFNIPSVMKNQLLGLTKHCSLCMEALQLSNYMKAHKDLYNLFLTR